jgi:hypothetical protein
MQRMSKQGPNAQNYEVVEPFSTDYELENLWEGIGQLRILVASSTHQE